MKQPVKYVKYEYHTDLSKSDFFTNLIALVGIIGWLVYHIMETTP